MKLNKLLTKIKEIKWGDHPLVVISLVLLLFSLCLLLSVHVRFGDVETFNEVRCPFCKVMEK